MTPAITSRPSLFPPLPPSTSLPSIHPSSRDLLRKASRPPSPTCSPFCIDLHLPPSHCADTRRDGQSGPGYPSHSGITLYLLLMISCVMFEGVCDRSSTTLVNDCRTSDAHERVLLCEVIAGVTSLLFVHLLFPLLISPLFFLFEFFPQDKPAFFIFLLIFYLVYAS